MNRAAFLAYLMLSGCAASPYLGDYERERFWRHAMRQQLEIPKRDGSILFQCGQSSQGLSDTLNRMKGSLRLKIQQDEEFEIYGSGPVVDNLVDIRHVNWIHRVKSQSGEQKIVMVLYIGPWDLFTLGRTYGVAAVILPCQTELLDVFVWAMDDQ